MPQAPERTADIAPIMQEIVDRGGWTSGNAMAFIITGSGDRAADTLNVAPNDVATLHIEYMEGEFVTAVEIDVDPWDPAEKCIQVRMS